MTPGETLKAFLEVAKEQNVKMDGLLVGLSALTPQVADAKSDIRFLRSENMKVQKEQSRHGERVVGLSGDIQEAHEKIRKHVGNSTLHKSKADAFTDGTVRWKFVGQVAIALGAIATLFVGLAQLLP